MSSFDPLVWNQRAAMPTPRAGCAVGVLGETVLVAGGTYWQDGKKFWSELVDSFDPATNQWRQETPLPAPHGDAAGAVAAGAFWMFGGGTGATTENSTWSFRAGRWSLESAMTLPAARRSAMVAVHDGTFFLFGGLAGAWNDFASLTATVWSARPGGPWIERRPVPAPLRFNTAVAAVDGRIVLAGGCTVENGAVRNLDEILAYDPAKDEWTRIGRLPQPSRGGWGVAEGASLLVVGGYTDQFQTELCRVEVATGQVTSAGALPYGLADTRAVRFHDQVIVVTGENGIKLRSPWTLESGELSR